MTSGGPDLFVVCKSCHAEVSPYITECPYCGARLRKRAPKIDRDGQISDPARARRPRRRPGPSQSPTSAPSLGRLRRGEIAGIRGDSRPVVTPAWVVASLIVLVLVRAAPETVGHLALIEGVNRWWAIFTAPFVYAGAGNTGYAFLALGAIAVFGWLLERRHGPVAMLLVAIAGGAGGMLLAAALEANAVAVGGNGAALALLIAWAIPDARAARSRDYWEGDLLGTAVWGAALAVVPLFVSGADWLAGLGGIVAGLVLGFVLDRLRPAT